MLAQLMFAPEAFIMGGGGFGFWSFLDPEPVVEVLRGRRPDWIDTWVEGWITGRESLWTNRNGPRPPANSWPIVRALMAAGLLERPDTGGYFGLLAWRDPEVEVDIDPSILEHELWELFRHHTVAFHNNDKNLHAFDWRGAVVRWVSSRELSRERVLRACLDGLTAVEGAATLSGLTKVFEALSPSVDDLADLQATLMSILGHDSSRVRGFAIKHLLTLHKEERLDADAFVERLSPVVSTPTKGTVQKALQIVSSLLAKSAVHINDAADGLARALEHEAVGVPDAALDILETHAAALSKAPRARLQNLSVSKAIADRYARWATSSVDDDGTRAPR